MSNESLTQITDEMLQNNLHSASNLAMIIGIVSALVGIVLLIIFVKIIKKRKNQKESSRSGLVLMTLFLVIGACIGGTIFGILEFKDNYRAEKNGYTVYLESVVGKEESKNHRARKRNHNFLILSTLGKQMVTDNIYEKYDVGDMVIIVYSCDEKVIRAFDSMEYVYVGEHYYLTQEFSKK